MKPLSILNRIPRTQLYLSNREIVGSIGRLLLNGPGYGFPVEQFAKEFAAQWKVRGAVAGSYARLCFYFAIKALNLPPGSEIITTPITIHDIINMIISNGHRPVFVDIDPTTYQMDPAALERAITCRTKAVLVTHLFGIASDMDKIVPICEKHNLALLEDASHSFGTALHRKRMGTFGKAGIFSLSSVKSITAGYGGVIVSDDMEFLTTVNESFHLLRQCKRQDLWDIFVKNLIVGLITSRFIFGCAAFPAIRFLNSRNPLVVNRLQTDNPEQKIIHEPLPEWMWQFSPLQADMAIRCLRRVDAENKKRQSNAQILFDILLPHAVNRLPRLLEDSYNVFWRFPFKAPEGREFMKYMNRYGIDVTTTLLPCCTKMSIFQEYVQSAPHAEKVPQEVFFLPIEHGLSEKQISTLAKVVLAFVRAGG
jgi:perosamine synthetase